MQKYLNVKLYDNDTSYYAQLYLYDLIFAVEQRITRNSRLNPNLLHQFMEILPGYNPFINIYKTAAEKIQSFNTNTIKKVYIVLNPQIKLFLELKVDCW